MGMTVVSFSGASDAVVIVDGGVQGEASVEGSSGDGERSVMVSAIGEGSSGTSSISFLVESAAGLVVDDSVQRVGVESSSEGGLRSVTLEQTTFVEA
jgi:hypothetical protein